MVPSEAREKTYGIGKRAGKRVSVMQKNGQRLLESKIQIPEMPKEFQVREKLLEQLVRAREQLVILHATIGYGKTVLMSQYAQLLDCDCAWYHLDALDNDPATFLQYLVLSFQRALGEFAFKADLSVLAEGFCMQRMIRELVTELTGHLNHTEKEFVLVLDDFQVLENRDIFLLLEELLDHANGRFRMMIATKSMVPELFSRYLMRGQGYILAYGELSFRSEEVRAVVGRMLTEEEADRYSEVIWRNMEGWPAGVMSAALCLRQLGNRALKLEWSHISQESLIGNYMTYELFKGLPYEIQQFLLRTSFAEELQPELCNEICGIHNAGAILKYLLQENMFIMRVGKKAGSYRYHSMFRQFLQERAGEQTRRESRSRIAGCYLSRQETAVALDYALRAENTELLAAILGKAGLSMLEEGKSRQVGECLACLEKKEAVLTTELLFLTAVRAFWEGDDGKGLEAMAQTAEKDVSCAVYQRLYERLLAEDREKGDLLLKESCQKLQQQGRKLPPLRAEKKTLAEDMWNRVGGGARLYVHCFGNFRAEVRPDSRELSWRTRKTMELFACLMDREGRPVERKDLLLLLWPEKEPGHAVNMLHNMIYSIRRELNPWPELKELIPYRNHQYELDLSLLDTDLSVFQEIFSLADQGRAEELYPYRERILHEYGPYLETVDGGWCSPRRAYFERAYTRTCRLLAKYCREQGDLETEIGCWSACREADRYSEEALVGLLRCYGAMGERSLLKETFESALRLFQEELGVDPGEEVMRAYEEAVRNKFT